MPLHTINPNHSKNRQSLSPRTTTHNEVTEIENSTPKPDSKHRHNQSNHGSHTTTTSILSTSGATSYHGVPNMELPLPLLIANADGKWEVCQEAADVLKNITAELAVVAIVGKGMWI